jgi:uncharacterized protein YbaR (Trm112 family)
MQLSTLEILRCPYCGGRLVVTAPARGRCTDEIDDGVLSCRCAAFPIVSGIPVMYSGGLAAPALEHLQAGRPDLARRTLIDLDPDQGARFDDVARSEGATYRDALDALGPTYERAYFLYRFSDPSYVVADALIHGVARGVLARGGRAIDICGGSGHLTRLLLQLSSPAPVLADLYFPKLWLARRFTATGCEAVCCNGNFPLPFTRGAFRYAMCADAFMFIWFKRQFVREMLRLIDGGRDGGAAVISHTHNKLTWSASHGQPLPPRGYADLFETIPCRVFGEAGLFADVVSGGPLDLARRDRPQRLAADPALVIVASRDPAVFRSHPLDGLRETTGELRVNPLYAIDRDGDRVHLRLEFPSPDYESEFGECRQYLPPAATIDRTSLAALSAGRVPADLVELARRRVILDLPRKYY